MEITIRNKRLSDDEFFREREEVLAEYPTGKEVDLDEAIEYHKTLFPNRNMTSILRSAKQNGDTCCGGHTGHATLEQEIELATYVQDEGGADWLTLHCDSFTRVKNYEAAERGLRESERAGHTTLNGFPVVYHGVAGVRKVIESLHIPLYSYTNTDDPRLITEIELAGGITGVAGDGLATFIGLSKLPLEPVLRNFQYKYRLVGYYTERGIPIIYNLGVYSGMTPVSAMIAIHMCTVMMAAEQGVKHVAIFPSQMGSIFQDVVCAKVFQKLTHEYLVRFGYSDVETFLNPGDHLYLYPEDIGRSFATVCRYALSVAICRAQMCAAKSIVEAKRLPAKEDDAVTLRCLKAMINWLKDQKIEIDAKAMKEEAEEIELETRVILDRVIELGQGDWAVGAIRAIESGVIDYGFAANPHVLGKIMGAKDAQGVVRYLDPGNVPLTKDMVDFHKQKLAEREQKQGKKVTYDTVLDDLMALSRGELIAH